jgi:hypothetical protein
MAQKTVYRVLLEWQEQKYGKAVMQWKRGLQTEEEMIKATYAIDVQVHRIRQMLETEHKYTVTALIATVGIEELLKFVQYCKCLE